MTKNAIDIFHPPTGINEYLYCISQRTKEVLSRCICTLFLRAMHHCLLGSTALTLSAWVGGSFSPGEVCRGNVYVLSKTLVSITFHWPPYIRYSVYNQHKIEFRNVSNQTEHKNILSRTFALTRTNNTRPHCSIIYLELKYIG
jgi:hypothetical protein